MPLPDLIEIVPLDKPVRAEITVPGSKSITNRALILAALANGDVTLKGALWSEDTQIMVDCLKQLGFVVNVAADPDEPCNRTILVMGQGGLVPPGGTVSEAGRVVRGQRKHGARFWCRSCAWAAVFIACTALRACMSARKKICSMPCASSATTWNLKTRTTGCRRGFFQATSSAHPNRRRNLSSASRRAAGAQSNAM